MILIGVSALGPFVVRRVGLGVLVRTRDRLRAERCPRESCSMDSWFSSAE